MNVSGFWKNKFTPYMCQLNSFITKPLSSRILPCTHQRHSKAFALVSYTSLIQKIGI